MQAVLHFEFIGASFSQEEIDNTPYSDGILTPGWRDASPSNPRLPHPIRSLVHQIPRLNPPIPYLLPVVGALMGQNPMRGTLNLQRCKQKGQNRHEHCYYIHDSLLPQSYHSLEIIKPQLLID